MRITDSGYKICNLNSNTVSEIFEHKNRQQIYLYEKSEKLYIKYKLFYITIHIYFLFMAELSAS